MLCKMATCLRASGAFPTSRWATHSITGIVRLSCFRKHAHSVAHQKATRLFLDTAWSDRDALSPEPTSPGDGMSPGRGPAASLDRLRYPSLHKTYVERRKRRADDRKRWKACRRRLYRALACCVRESKRRRGGEVAAAEQAGPRPRRPASPLPHVPTESDGWVHEFTWFLNDVPWKEPRYTDPSAPTRDGGFERRSSAARRPRKMR